MNKLHVCLLFLGTVAFCQTAHGQVGFFFPGASAFTPEISVVNTGVLNDVQATVSADQKYVTLNMRPQNATLLALRSFNFQQGAAFGNVGDPPPTGGRAGANRDDPSAAVNSSPSEILAHAKSQASILHQPGMTRVSSLKG